MSKKNDPCDSCGFSPSAKLGGTWTLILEVGLKSGNQIGANARGRCGWRYRSAQGEYKRALKCKLHSVDAQLVDTKRRLTLVRYYGKNCHAYDYDNLVWGFKPIVDQLVQADILIDDSPKYIERVYKQTKSPDGVDHIIVTIEELIGRKGKG